MCLLRYTTGRQKPKDTMQMECNTTSTNTHSVAAAFTLAIGLVHKKKILLYGSRGINLSLFRVSRVVFSQVVQTTNFVERKKIKIPLYD
jgi:hypothetical protein